MFLGKLIDKKVQLINKKQIKILPDGSLFFNYTNILKIRQIILLKNYNKNLIFKKVKHNLESKDFINYKDKYLN